MSDKPVPYIPEVVALSLDGQLVRLELDAKITQLNITDITGTASKTMIDVAEKQFAIPAQEKTKQEQEVTKRSEHENKRFYAAALAVLLGCGLISWHPTAGPWIAAALAVLAGPEFISRLKKKPE